MPDDASHPAQAARQFLGQRPPTLPPVMRWTLAAGLALFAAYGAMLVYFYAADRALFWDALFMHINSFGGREGAMLVAYTGDDPAPFVWVAVWGLLIDLSHLFAILAIVWYLFAALARVPGPDRFLAGLEKAALKQRKWIRRWGLAGLALFYWLPGYGTGAFAIAAIGVLARIPPRRLVPVMALAAATVSLFWAWTLHKASAALPQEGWWSLLPILIIVVVVGIAIVSAIMQWRTRHILLLPWPVPDHLWSPRFEGIGMRRVGDCLEVDSNVLAAKAGIDADRPRRVRSVAELMLMPGMDLDLARRLEGRGVVGMESLAQLPTASLLGAIEDADVSRTHDGPVLARMWQREATAMEMAAGEAWVGKRPGPG